MQNMKKNTSAISNAKRNLYLVMSESAITAGIMAMSIMTPFFNSVGLNNEQISLTQIAFTVVVIILNIPTGYIADRISRKWANIIGDFCHGFLFIAYAFTNNFLGIVICESLMGVMSALSGGVDQSLLKHFAGKLSKATGESENKILKSKTAKLELYKQICTLILLALGGPIGAIDLRLAIALSSISQFAGGIISIFIEDDSEKFIPIHKNPIKDMSHIAKTALKSKPLRLRIFTCAIGGEMTHVIIWIVTPLFMQAGVPLSLVSLAWVFNALTTMLGAWLAGKFSHKLTDSQIFTLPVVLMAISMIAMGVSLNIVTVWLYGLMGVVRGWSASTLRPMIQKYTKPSEQTSVLSLTQVISELIYIPIVWLVGFMADIKLEYGLLVTVAVFLPAGLLIIKKLKQSV